MSIRTTIIANPKSAESAKTPEHLLGAPMVSSEGACAAYYRYRRKEHP